MGVPPRLSLLPGDVAASARVASVSAAARSLARRAAPLDLAVRLGDDGAARLAVASWIKLAELEPTSVTLAVDDAAATSITITRRGRTTTLDQDALAGGLDEALATALEALVPAAELARIARRACAELARVTALQAVVERMLAAPDEHGATTALLAGVTAGSGLGFHRAALFVPAEGGAFHGSRAVGPVDRDEAHRVWESIEADGVAFDLQVERAGSRSRLEERVRGLHLAPRATADDPLARAMRGEVVIADGGTAVAPELAAIDPADTFVVCRVAAGDEVLALLFADRRFGDPAIDDETARALAAFLAHAALAWQARNLLRETDRLARRDALTGLWNRRALEELLATETRAAAEGGSLGLLLLDLDHFREVNAARGHPGGDALLREAAAVLGAVVGDAGHGARFGGDELAVILPGATAADVAAAAGRIGREAAARDVSLSVGAAVAPTDGTDGGALVAAADARLYAAKAAGRGRAVVPGQEHPIVFTQGAPPE